MAHGAKVIKRSRKVIIIKKNTRTQNKWMKNTKQQIPVILGTNVTPAAVVTMVCKGSIISSELSIYTTSDLLQNIQG